MEKSRLIEITGGLSKTSKMPCHSYNIPATSCKTGSILCTIKGTNCEHCYARKGRYLFSNVQQILNKRLESIHKDEWVDAMAELINSTGNTHFRWHDSGDLQGTWHLKKIFEVCRKTPNVKHWLPTLEAGILLKTLAEKTAPENLTIRVSATKVDSVPSTAKWLRSMIYSKPIASSIKDVHECQAVINHTNCGNCRACWDKNIKLIAYRRH